MYQHMANSDSPPSQERLCDYRGQCGRDRRECVWPQGNCARGKSPASREVHMNGRTLEDRWVREIRDTIGTHALVGMRRHRKPAQTHQYSHAIQITLVRASTTGRKMES